MTWDDSRRASARVHEPNRRKFIEGGIGAVARRNRTLSLLAAALLAFLAACCFSLPSIAQEQAAADAAPAAAEQAPDPLDDDELEVLVARIALYPDELVAVISEASLYPLQIVEAARFLEKAAKDKNLKPKDTWDGSVISLLNYPEIVKMMSDDLEWTQTLGDALTYQQKDVLIAIQQLRDKAVAAGAIKTDDKIKVEQSATTSSSSRPIRRSSMCRSTSRRCSTRRTTRSRRSATIPTPIHPTGTRRLHISPAP